jgi:BirA family biotin operon repressor/biotin-[acetyl-CoA-carboxylase] ligase
MVDMAPEHLTVETFSAQLRTQRLGRAPGISNEVWNAIDSTNNRALELARGGAPEGVVVAARSQTAGKGRAGRSWVSPIDAGLYMSVLLRPRMPATTQPLLSFAAGVAVVNAIADCHGVRPGLKWVNDIVYGGRKLGGILAEAATTVGGVAAVVVGIGINLRAPGQSDASVPAELRQTAVWLDQIIERAADANALAATIINRFEQQYFRLERADVAGVINAWRADSITLGREVRAVGSDIDCTGIASDVAEDGALIVLTPAGKQVRLHSGDVSIRNPDGSYC